MKKILFIIVLFVTPTLQAQLVPVAPKIQSEINTLEKNATTGDVEAMYVLAYYYLNGIDHLLAPKVGKGKKLMQQAAESGNANACRMMYKLNPMRNEVYRDMAVKKYKAEATGEAFYCIADLYGNEPNICQRWLKTAAEVGYSPAYRALESIYKNKYSRGDVSFLDWSESIAPYMEYVVQQEQPEKEIEIVYNSDVDKNLPLVKEQNEDALAIIIGNQVYQHMPDVSFAMNDAGMFAEYCKKILGVPEKQVFYMPNATGGKIRNMMKNTLQNIAESFGSNLNIIFYYSGHGYPDETDQKNALLIPVDADNVQSLSCYSTTDLFTDLWQTGANKITVFMDACFTGISRAGESIADNRLPVKKPKFGPRGNTVVFSATDDKQTAWPLKEENHGIFTYYLLKRLKETEGKVSLDELSEYLKTKVSREASLRQTKQTPTVESSQTIGDEWKTWSLR